MYQEFGQGLTGAFLGSPWCGLVAQWHSADSWPGLESLRRLAHTLGASTGTAGRLCSAMPFSFQESSGISIQSLQQDSVTSSVENEDPQGLGSETRSESRPTLRSWSKQSQGLPRFEGCGEFI